MHACKHADSNQLGHLHIPLIRPSKTASSTMFPTLYSRSWRSDHTNCATVFTQYTLGQSWSQILQFQNGCLFLHTKTCEFLSLLPPVHQLRNQIVAGVVPDASTLWSTYSHRLGHSSLATPQNASVHLQYLQASFHRLIQTNSNIGSHNQGETQSHMHTLLQNSRQFPSNVFTTEFRWVQD